LFNRYRETRYRCSPWLRANCGTEQLINW
jgi:hypothetical protein